MRGLIRVLQAKPDNTDTAEQLMRKLEELGGSFDATTEHMGIRLEKLGKLQEAEKTRAAHRMLSLESSMERLEQLFTTIAVQQGVDPGKCSPNSKVFPCYCPPRPPPSLPTPSAPFPFPSPSPSLSPSPPSPSVSALCLRAVRANKSFRIVCIQLYCISVAICCRTTLVQQAPPPPSI